MGTLISRVLEHKFGLRFPFYHGGLTAEERNSIVSQFQAEHDALISGSKLGPS
eukprot:CAMPEP_0172896674 /NCGR_PEP_ID=MMETSP1075-20121228/155980_1 /TAXON_ID=2916 /ORGANISM="Ceratium fusus, Strain PA161109" /LENGTH=52 /DNA_ID=CAMNT_0013752123 /DNA_START=84 /DNA_END=239 /DNA_ORIENTATION=+